MEEQFLIPEDQILNLRNISTKIPDNKSFFVLNDSWRRNL